MGLLDERTETRTEIRVVFRWLWIPYWLFIVSLPFVIFADLFGASLGETIRRVAFWVNAVGLVGMAYASIQFAKLRKEKWTRFSGHKLSPTNPLTVRVLKRAPALTPRGSSPAPHRGATVSATEGSAAPPRDRDGRR